MSDDADEIGQGGNGAIWHLRQPEERDARALRGPIVFELADANGAMLAAISMRAERIEELLRPYLSIFAELQLDGTVFLGSELFALFPPDSPPNLLEMVRQALALEMLQDEPNLKSQLLELQRKLTDSLALVDKTLADLEKPQT